MVPAYRLDLTVALTNRVPTTVVRGAGRPQAVFAMERLIDRIARELGSIARKCAAATWSVRSRCRTRSGCSSATASRWSMPAEIFQSVWSAPSRLPTTRNSAARQAAARAEGRYIGIGIGNYVEGTGLGPFEGVTVRVLPNGKVAVATGATSKDKARAPPCRRSWRTRSAAAMEDIVMTTGDTAAISQGVGAFASRQAVNAGSSARIAGANVRGIVALAARALGVPQDEIDVEEGRAAARTGNKPSMSLGELARLAQGMPGFSFAPGQSPGLEHTAYFAPPQASYCNGTHVAEVEVDPFTGGVTHPQLHGGA